MDSGPSCNYRPQEISVFAARSFVGLQLLKSQPIAVAKVRIIRGEYLAFKRFDVSIEIGFQLPAILNPHDLAMVKLEPCLGIGLEIRPFGGLRSSGRYRIGFWFGERRAFFLHRFVDCAVDSLRLSID